MEDGWWAFFSFAPFYFGFTSPLVAATVADRQFIGALLDEVPKDDDPASLKMSGSTLVAVASSREEIMEVLKADPYAKEGVWDLDKVSLARIPSQK